MYWLKACARQGREERDSAARTELLNLTIEPTKYTRANNKRFDDVDVITTLKLCRNDKIFSASKRSSGN